MKTHTLIRWSGLLLIVAAVFLVLFGLHTIVDLPILGGHTSSLLGLMLFVLAITGVYADQHEQSGALGLVAFVLSVLGAILVSGANLISIARERGVGGANAVIAFYAGISLDKISVMSFLVGLFLLGIVTIRAGAQQRWAGILLIIGAALVLVGFIVLDPLTILGFSVTGAALAWMGYALWSSKGITKSQVA